MNGFQRIGVYYSQSHHFVGALRHVHKQYPDARITVIVPAGYPISSEARSLADDVMETERARYGLRDAAACLRLVRTLRAGRYDLFVILFNSPRLRVLARFSTSPRCAVYAADGSLTEIRPSVLGTLTEEACCRLTGLITFVGVWLAVHLLPVRSRT